MSLFSQWSRQDAWNSQPTLEITPSPIAALKFLVVAATSGIEDYTLGDLGLTQKKVATAGLGAASVVQIGKTRNGKLVAVKLDRATSQPLAQIESAHFERHLNRLALEIQILANDCVKQHENILNIMGFGMQEYGGQPCCFLVEEYSGLGDLKTFLLSGPSISSYQQLEFCLDISKALETLHSLKVCHGDIKVENALVFKRDNQPGWLIKLADFSHAIVASEGDPEGPVPLGLGTPLLRAPELTNGSASCEGYSNIVTAMKADTFSFGLFVWEVFKFGLTYFENTWFTNLTQGYSVNDLETKETFLRTLSQNALCELGVAFLESRQDLDEVSLQTVRDIFNASLEYEPSKRSQVGELAEILRRSVRSINKHEPNDIIRKTQPSESNGQIFALPSHQSLFEILESGFAAGQAFDQFPFSFQCQVVSDLERLAGSPGNLSASQTNAAMTVSECYAVGYGVKSDMTSVLHWLYQAALAGSAKAVAWYHRVCITVGSSPLALEKAATYKDCEDRLSEIPVEDYLLARIQMLELVRRREATLTFESLYVGKASVEPRIADLATFHHLQIDNVGRIHVAAWLGLDSIITELVVSPSQMNVKSKLGRNAIFYACLGGSLSTLRFLINSGANVDQRDVYGISPLHLCVFFPQHAVKDAVDLLIKHGADPNAVMNGRLEWEEHDITLLGTPMEWAVRCRHSKLIEILLQTTAKSKSLNTAIELFFWEIVDLLLLEKAWDNEEPPQLALSAIARPYRHWIAHGKDHLHSLSRTLDVLEKHGLNLDKEFDGLTLLIYIICGSQTIDDFEIVCQLARRGQNVKFASADGFTALGYAISRAKNNEDWTKTLQYLLAYYDVSELEQNYMYDGSYIHAAVTSDSVIGVRELLRKGVDVNQPTYDALKTTPIDTCVFCDGSPEMMTLLLENGASTKARWDNDIESSPLENRLFGLQRNSELLDLLLQCHSPEELSLNPLPKTLISAFAVTDTDRKDSLEAFRHLISKPAAQLLVNHELSGEGTLLHMAANALNPYLVKLLLEAGADVRVSANIRGLDLNPLQLALGMGKFLWDTHTSGSQSNTDIHERGRRAAFDTARLLLSEHTSHEDGLFDGITPLHLAAYMGIVDIVAELTAVPDIDSEAKGSWPGQAGLLTPAQLLAATLAPDTCGYPGVKHISNTSEQHQLLHLDNAPINHPLEQETKDRSLPFQDREDIHLEIEDTKGDEMTLTISPRLIYNNASHVLRLLGYKFSPSV